MMILTPSRVGKSMESDCVGSLVIIGLQLTASQDLAGLGCPFEASAVFSPPWEALAMVMLLVLTGPIFEASTVLSPSCGG